MVLTHTHNRWMVERQWGGGGVLAAQLRRPAATAAAGHPPLTAAAAAATTVVVYVLRHPCTYARRRLCASASRTPAPRRAVASRSTPRPARSITHAAVARRGFPIVARVLFCVHSSAVRRTRRAHSAAIRFTLSTRTYPCAERAFFRFLSRRRFLVEFPPTASRLAIPPTPLHCPQPPLSQRFADRRHCSRRRPRR